MFNTFLVAIFLAAIQATAIAADLTTQRNSANGVTVAITPVDVATASSSWLFKVVLDTHTQPLDDDLVKATVLIDDKGIKYSPAAWEGDAPGSHHREGTLMFKAIPKQSQSFELQIQRTGEAQFRSFRW